MNRKYRKAIIAGNWKMNKTASETVAFVNALKPLLPKERSCEVLLCVPALNITTAQKALKGCRIGVGAENVHEETAGAFTGETSAAMLADLGVKYVIIGHSERRQYYHETDITVNRKLRTALDAGLSPIVCVGESSEQRELGVENELLSYQLMTAIAGLSAAELRRVIVAYEPVWAIGTGKTATAEQAQAVCAHLRGCIRARFDARVARAIPILYGGSMNQDNAAQLLAMPDIDGGLIGSAALQPREFVNLITICGQVEHA